MRRPVESVTATWPRRLLFALGDEDSPSEADQRKLLLFALAEIACLVLLFFAYASSPPPDVNEAHYLTKAKHYWNPAWLAGDHFLESSDAHLVFYWAFGWLTLWLPLPVVAWVGRFATWLGLAVAFRRMGRGLSAAPFFSVLAGALLVVLLHYFHMAGEWLIGGVEAKGFAFVFVFLALDCLARKRTNTAVVLCGVAAAFHVLVGGWALIAVAIAWLLEGKDLLRPARIALALAVGFICSLPGLLPALWLTRSAPADVVARANEIYVYERLSHHLVPSEFVTMNAFGYEWVSWFILRFLLLVIVWYVLWRLNRSNERQAPIHRFVVGACLIAACGFILNAVAFNWPDRGASLLRFYWFRLSDFAVPLGAAILLALVWVAAHRSVDGSLRWALRGALILPAVFFAMCLYQRAIDPRPQGDQQAALVSHLTIEEKIELSKEWQATTDWVRENTPPDARFITPKSQQTFKWYARRSEVVNWKDVPQNAAALVEWSDRMNEVYPPDWEEFGMTVHGDEDLIRIGEKYQAQYLLSYRPHFRRPPEFEKLYPSHDRPANFEIYKIPRK